MQDNADSEVEVGILKSIKAGSTLQALQKIATLLLRLGPRLRQPLIFSTLATQVIFTASREKSVEKANAYAELILDVLSQLRRTHRTTAKTFMHRLVALYTCTIQRTSVDPSTYPVTLQVDEEMSICLESFEMASITCLIMLIVFSSVMERVPDCLCDTHPQLISIITQTFSLAASAHEQPLYREIRASLVKHTIGLLRHTTEFQGGTSEVYDIELLFEEMALLLYQFLTEYHDRSNDGLLKSISLVFLAQLERSEPFCQATSSTLHSNTQKSISSMITATNIPITTMEAICLLACKIMEVTTIRFHNLQDCIDMCHRYPELRIVGVRLSLITGNDMLDHKVTSNRKRSAENMDNFGSNKHARVQLVANLASHLHQTKHQLLIAYEKQLCIFVANNLTVDRQLVADIAYLYDLDLEGFLNFACPTILPHFIAERRRSGVDMLLHYLDNSLSALCLQHSFQITKHILVQLPDERYAAAVEFFETIAGPDTSFQDLMNLCEVRLVYSLALDLSDMDIQHQTEVALARITKFCQLDSISNLLSTHMLNILIRMDGLVEDIQKGEAGAPDVQVMSSLKWIMKEIGPGVCEHINYISGTILGISQCLNGHAIAIDAWKSIVDVLLPEDRSKHASIIVGSLSSLVCRCEGEEMEKVVKILKSLVTTDGNEVEKYAGTLNIPNRPELQEIHKLIKSKRRAVPHKVMLQDCIERAYTGDVSELEVALRSIYNILSSGDLPKSERIRSGFHDWLTDEYRSDLYTLLLELCQRRISEESVQILIAKCLGAIGAADPKRVNVDISDHRVVVMQNFEDMDENRAFALHLIQNHLYRALLESQNGNIQRRVQYSIQVLLRYCGFTAGSDSHQKSPVTQRLWNEFSPAVKEAVAPLLTSSLASNWTWQKKHSIIYPASESFEQWIVDWTMSLISISRAEAHSIFNSCSPLILTRNISLATYLLPYIVLHNVIAGRQDDILKEILSVLGAAPGHSEHKRQACLQVIVNVVDHCSVWTQRMKAKLGSRSQSPAIDPVVRFIESIPHERMASAAYQCQAYARALLDLEQHIRANGMTDDSNKQLQRIYAHLDDPDAMAGLRIKFAPSYSQEQELLLLETNRKWDLAEYHYEKLNFNPEMHLNDVFGHLNCLQKQGKYESMLSVASKFKEIDPSLASKLAPFMVEAAWHERQWSLLNMHLAEVTEHTTSTRIAQVMACMYNNDRQGAYRALQQARLHCIKQLASGKLESYVRSYDDILNLQMLFELETTYAVGEEIEHVAKTQLHFRMTSDWEQKLNLMPFGSKFQGELLDLRTIALEFLKSSDKKLAVDYFLMKNDLQRCKIARKEGNFEEAYRALVSIEYEPPSAHTSNEAMKCLARAKYLWHSGQRIDAIQFLSGQHLEPKGRLLLTRWKEEMGLLKLEELQTEYEDIVRRFTDYENATYRYAKDIQYSHYYLGRYYDRILTASEDITERQYLDTANSVCLEYVKTLELGSKFLYNAMPRLLTVWLDLGTFVSNDEGDSQAVIRRLFNDVTTRVKSSNISPQLWSVVLPRLVSRLDHQNSTICGALVAIIRKVFQAYPSSSVWHLIAHANISSTQHASSKARAIHCESILKKTAGGAEGRKLLKIVDQAKTVVRCLKELAQHSYDASSRSQPITPSLSSLKDIDICVPIEAAIMPTANITEDMPTIKRFGSKILVMSSLQKPRRISILGSNGQEYRFLCKANDDLRKDARMMEFNVMINTFLKKDREARDRSLYIRTYAVTPLGDLWGLIEWVNHTTPLKAIVQRQWEAMGKDVGKIAQLAKRELDPNNMRSVEDRIWAFENKVLPECPPVLHRWFLQTFREPSQWLAARTQFTRTLATMSIVGYILGLGDRHAENILLHEKTGDVVHVDVNMLFDRGQKLPVPEVVPFRLTHNLSDAMGLFGYEGTFRRSCEIVLRALQENKISLLSVFETLVHDPIVEWKRYGERQTIQARAKRQLDAIERKIDAAGNTIQNEVSRLIQDATSNSNLATMFIDNDQIALLNEGGAFVCESATGMLAGNGQPRLTGSQDLLSLFNLNGLYDEYVRPYITGNEADTLEPTFSNYIGLLPGKFDMEPDNYLMQLIRNPQQIDIGRGIEPFPEDVLRESFSLQQGRIPEFDTSLLGLDEGDSTTQSNVKRMPSIKMTFGSRIGEGMHQAATGDQGIDKRHKKKKKKRKHGHENEEDGHVHSDHKKKKKRKRERESGGQDNESDPVVIDD